MWINRIHINCLLHLISIVQHYVRVGVVRKSRNRSTARKKQIGRTDSIDRRDTRLITHI